jgi:hypothetical protein
MDEAILAQARLQDTDIAGIGSVEDLTYKVDVVFNEEGEGVSGFEVVGANSKRYQDAVRLSDVGAVKRAHARGRPIDPKSDDGATTLVEGAQKREMAIACACVVAMYGFTAAGAPVEPTPAILRDLFTKRPTWRKKVVAAAESEANFTGS